MKYLGPALPSRHLHILVFVPLVFDHEVHDRKGDQQYHEHCCSTLAPKVFSKCWKLWAIPEEYGFYY